MKLRSKILSLLLIATLTTATLAASSGEARWPSPSAQLHERPSGCHGHSGKAPIQAPSHDCCLTAHDVAALQTSHIPRPDVHRKQADLSLEPWSVITIPAAMHPSPICSAVPPGITPFRI